MDSPDDVLRMKMHSVNEIAKQIEEKLKQREADAKKIAEENKTDNSPKDDE
jgi:hypothetical protein